MTSLDLVTGAALLGLTARQALVLRGIWRSRRFLTQSEFGFHGGPGGATTCDESTCLPTFYIVLPVLREAQIICSTIDHFEALLKGHSGAIVVVTTAREAAEGASLGDADTVQAVDALARAGRCIHLHYPDPTGLKADQLNFAAEYCRASLAGRSGTAAFLVCYDADSRPPLDSLDHFGQAIAAHPDVDVFHQSARFELRDATSARNRRWAAGLRRLIADSGALRANRFVFAYEIPRLLNRSSRVSELKQRLSSYVYTHVTGHGLCVRLALLRDLPFPARSPLEDMHYSFLLGSRNLPMLPIPSLDCAEVPIALRTQIEQAARWFYGPGRFRRYLRDPRTRPGVRARMLALSALAISVEWVSCAALPVLLILLLASAGGFARATVSLFLIVYAMQLVTVEAFIGAAAPLRLRLGRALAYPVGCILFGIGGVIGAGRLLLGHSGAGKTERDRG